ncbi:MAG: hypothetical protein OEV49_12900 [candidate division Zixibacteria bacterium]|nr:hypothetical protein [candidate division Zixibacteria bacterium]MDH3937897.1 hypothetical protein [candidate division Zixibacteria bacterium]MDH4034063.1 hypothetical protein [candidate division Zixibacteria bacterium]
MSGILSSVYAKIIIGSILGFVGVAGGIYLGYALTGTSPQQRIPADWEMEIEPDPRVQPAFQAGDLFPPVNCVSMAGDTVNFSEVIDGRPTAFVFAAPGCEPCYNLLKFWVEKVDPMMIPNGQLVICWPDTQDDPDYAYALIMEGKRVVKYSQTLLSDTYNVVLAPTTVVVDNQGFVQHIQLGFGGTLDYQIFELLTNAGR